MSAELKVCVTSFRIVLINMVTILIMSAKMATVGFLNIKIFGNKLYDVMFMSFKSAAKFYHLTQIIL